MRTRTGMNPDRASRNLSGQALEPSPDARRGGPGRAGDEAPSGTTKVLRQFAATALALAMIGVFGLPACSLLNQEGPDVSCADLECGRINACKEGIIAQCADGRHLKFHVCGSSDVCKQTWQTQGAFKCTSDATDCEGCRPDRKGCDDLPAGTGGAGGSGGATTSSGG